MTATPLHHRADVVWYPTGPLPLPRSLERWPDPVTPRMVGVCWLQDAIDHYLCRRANEALYAIGGPEPVKVAGNRHVDYMDAISICRSLIERRRSAA